MACAFAVPMHFAAMLAGPSGCCNEYACPSASREHPRTVNTALVHAWPCPSWQVQSSRGCVCRLGKKGQQTERGKLTQRVGRCSSLQSLRLSTPRRQAPRDKPVRSAGQSKGRFPAVQHRPGRRRRRWHEPQARACPAGKGRRAGRPPGRTMRAGASSCAADGARCADRRVVARDQAERRRFARIALQHSADSLS